MTNIIELAGKDFLTVVLKNLKKNRSAMGRKAKYISKTERTLEKNVVTFKDATSGGKKLRLDRPGI